MGCDDCIYLDRARFLCLADFCPYSDNFDEVDG